MAGAFILLAGAAAVPARAYLTSQADALAPDLLSDREGAVDHPTRPRHLARSDESRGSKRISMSHARSHDLERSDETPRDQRCTELIDGTSCPASIPDKTCNRHYCASCRIVPARCACADRPHGPPHRAARRHMCVARARRLPR